MKKIVIILPSPLSSKSAIQLRNREDFISKYSKKRGYSCEVFHLGFNKEKTQIDENNWLFPVDNLEKSDHNHTSITLLKEIEKRKPHLVIFKGMGYKLNRWLFFRSKHKFKYAFIVGGGTKDILSKNADYILAETRNQIEKNFKKFPQGKKDVLPKLLPSYFELNETNKEKEFDIINIGRMDEGKNQKDLLPLSYNFKIAMVGTGPLYKKIKNSVAKKGTKDNVKMFGQVPRDQIPLLISKSSIMVHTSGFEGMPRVFIESLVCGVPVIASKKAVPEDCFESGKQGLLVEPEEIIPETKRLLYDKKRLHRMSKNAREYAKKEFTKEKVSEVVEKMYNKVFSQNFSEGKKESIFKLKIRAFLYEMEAKLRKTGRVLHLNKVKNRIR